MTTRSTIKTIAMLALLGVGSITAPVAAQPAPAPPPTGPSPADKIYQEGRAHYDLREWDLAIAKFKEAYRLRPDAASLFNIAQSYRLKGDCVEAANFYKTYKRNFPSEKNIPQVEKFITDMEACAKTQPVTPTGTNPTGTNPTGTNPTGTNPTGTNPTGTNPTGTNPTNPTGTNPTGGQTGPNSGQLGPNGGQTGPNGGQVGTGPFGPTGPEQPSGSSGTGFKIAGAGFAVVGVAGIVVGVLQGMKASDKAETLEGLPVFDPAVEEDGKNASRNAKIFYGVGAGGLVLSGVFLYLGFRSSGESSSSVSVVPNHDGGMVVWSGRL